MLHTPAVNSCRGWSTRTFLLGRIDGLSRCDPSSNLIAALVAWAYRFVANIPVTNRTVESEIQNYVFTDRQRHPEAPHCMVVIAGKDKRPVARRFSAPEPAGFAGDARAGELYLEEVLTQASMMSFMEMIHIFRSLLEVRRMSHGPPACRAPTRS